MMRSPKSIVEALHDAEYVDLIKKRDEYIRFIRKFEKKEMAGDRSGREWMIDPKPDVRYQIYLDSLGLICQLMQEKYHDDYVWGERRLHQDVIARNDKS